MTRVSAAIATAWRWITQQRNVSSQSETLSPSAVALVEELGLSPSNTPAPSGAISSDTSLTGKDTSDASEPPSYANHELAPLFLCRHCEEAKQDHIGPEFKCVFVATYFDEMTCATCDAILFADDAYKLTTTDKPTCLVCAPRDANDAALAYFYKDKGL